MAGSIDNQSTEVDQAREKSDLDKWLRAMHTQWRKFILFGKPTRVSKVPALSTDRVQDAISHSMGDVLDTVRHSVRQRSARVSTETR